jgi:hypothetical protein
MAVQDIGSSPSDRSAEEAGVSRVYRTGATEQPPAATDARIRTAAHEAVSTAHVRGRGLKRWAVPFAIAATVVLSVGVALQISQQGVIEQEGPAVKSATAPESMATPPPIAQQKREAVPESVPARRRETASVEVSKLKQAAGSPTAPAAERSDDKPGSARESSEPLLSKRGDVAAAVAAKEAGGVVADVTKVQVSGSPGGYYFSVTIRSADKGCAQYADWWEVLGTDGKLLYRRVLLHSHTDEQPFERSGGPVPIQPEITVWVRAHMNTNGYGGAALKGSVKSGFAIATPPTGFAADAATQVPLPDGCAF